ncbi:MAG: haloacid dehalogenase type II [Proteobacteria bacterium]|nr:haloacid dehalogenase type II [Pseudomonadota bacterium]MBI3496781.1 haloacid dehalogenase type II [Pseudomonadota bacterium]
MQLAQFKVLTFDCYGTLIDWEAGIFHALQPLLAERQDGIPREAALAAFARHESAQEAETPAKIYSDLLAAVHRRLAAEWRVVVPEADHVAFGQSVGDWPAFPDSAASLRYLKTHYKLVILSNVDRSSFARSNKRLEVEFDAVYTAQDIGSYKPDPRNFGFMLEKLAERGYGRGDILHTAQSLFHDHGPANLAGLASAWIDRRHDRQGWGATAKPAGSPKYDFRFTSMADMVKAHQQEQPARHS